MHLFVKLLLLYCLFGTMFAVTEATATLPGSAVFNIPQIMCLIKQIDENHVKKFHFVLHALHLWTLLHLRKVISLSPSATTTKDLESLFDTVGHRSLFCCSHQHFRMKGLQRRVVIEELCRGDTQWRISSMATTQCLHHTHFMIREIYGLRLVPRQTSRHQP